MKRRSSSAVSQACESPSVKRTRVQAQRKFASNNCTYSGSRIMSRALEDFKVPVVSIPISSPEQDECELNTFSSLPAVDDLLTFLCFRDTEVLPARLDYLSSPQFDPPPPPLPLPKKYSKTNDASVLPTNYTSRDVISNERNKLANNGETDYRGSKKLDEYKKLRSRCLTSMNKASCSLALKHNQRLRSKNVVKAKLCESQLKSKSISTPENTAPLMSVGRATRTSARGRIETELTRPASPVKRVTRQNLGSPYLLNSPQELPKRVKSVTPSGKTSSRITSELPIRLESAPGSSASLPLSKLNIVSCSETSGAVLKKTEISTKPHTRSTRNTGYEVEVDLGSARPPFIRSAAIKRASQFPIRTTRSSGALRDETSRDSLSEKKTEDVAPSYSRPSRRTKEAATFYMELLGKELLCPGSDDDDSYSVDSFPELPSTDPYLRRVREQEKQQERNSPEKVTSRKMSGQKATSTKPPEKPPADQVTEAVPVETRNRRNSKDSLTHMKDKPTSRIASAVLEPMKTASHQIRETSASRRASESDEAKQLNERSMKSSTSQVARKLGTREASEIPDSKSSNERAAKSSIHSAPASPARRASKVVESNNPFEQPAKSLASPVAPKASEILDTKKSNEQSANYLIGQNTAKPTLQRASEIMETRNANEQSTKSSTSQVVMKPSRRAAADVLLRKPTGSSTGQVIVKTLSRKASKILNLKNSNHPLLKLSAIKAPTKPLLRRASEGLESKGPSEQSAKSSTSQIATKSASRRASETLIPQSSTNQLQKSSISHVVAESILRAVSICASKQPEKLSSDKLLLKQAPPRTSDVLEFGRSKEREKLVFQSSDANKVGIVTPDKKVPVQDNTSPTTIEVTIKDLTKRQEPEKSVFKKKVVTMKTSSTNISKENPCKKLGTQIRDLTKTSSVEMIRMVPKESSERDGRESLSSSGAVKTNNSGRRGSLSTDTEATAAKRSESPSPVDASKMVNVNSAEKKIFRKSEKELLRKSDAFSPDNEKSVYAFEPDLPTSSPPFRRLKPVTPPKMLSVNNAVAVQVNFGKDGQVECASAGDTRLSSTTDSEGDRVFYIPIETSAAATSTLGFAVKLDGPNPKILMSIITNSPAFTTNTVTDVQAKSAVAESICVQTDAVRPSSKVEQSTVTVASPSAMGGSANEPTIKRKVTPKSSPSKRQPVMIVKCKKRKKVGQGTNGNPTSSILKPKSTFKNEKGGRSALMHSVRVKSESVSSNQILRNTKLESKSICASRKVDPSTNTGSVQAKSEPVSVTQTLTNAKLLPKSIFTDRKVDRSASMDVARAKSGPVSTNQTQMVNVNKLTSEEPESQLKRSHKRVEITHQPAHVDQGTTRKILDVKLDPLVQNKSVLALHHLNKNRNTDTVDRTTASQIKMNKDDKEKLPMSDELTKVLHSASGIKKVNSLLRPTNDPSNDTASSRASPLSLPPSTSTKNSVPNKSSIPNRSKKVESSDNSSGADTPVADTCIHNVDVAVKRNAIELKPSKIEIPETKVKGTKVKARPQKTKDPEPSSSSTVKVSKSPGKILEAPTFRPTKEEFQDPLEYIESIRPVAEKFGLCRIVPPSDFRPECKVADEMRFTAYNQYVHKMLHRWGPNVKEMLAIKKFLATQNIELTQMPWIGGMEVDLPRVYQTVQQCGGLSAVIENGRWQSVADMMRIPKLAQDRITKLDDIYCKYLLPYDILSQEERERIFDDIEKEWAAHLKKSSDDDLFEDVDECVLKGRTMPLSCFYRIARNTMMMCFGTTDGHQGPSTETIEREFWKHVSDRKAHICVHSGSIDSGTHGYGFSVAKNSTFRKHPWNLKVLTNNATSILRFLGPVMGVTVPTLHVGMLYSAFCWYRDPHGLPWIEYLHTGAEKIWYGIPDEHSENFREAMLAVAPRFCRDKKIWLSSDTVMIPPRQLIAEGVSLSRVVQEPGQFIVVFPKAFTSSISTGYLVSESVYFAQASWLDSARQIFTDMRDSCEPSVFSLEQLVINIAEDTRPNVSILTKILPLLSEIREAEVNLRNQLRERGVSATERLNTNKKRKSKSPFPEEEYYECDVCHSNLFVSMVANSLKENFYCLQHAVAMFQRKSTQAKHYKLLYAYSEEELTELVDKVKSRIEAKNTKK